jgi:hypothetical protein
VVFSKVRNKENAMSQDKHTRKGEQIQQFLQEEASRWERATGFVQRASKVTGAVFVRGMVLSCLQKPEATLGDMVWLCRVWGVEVSEAGWQQRIGEAAVRLMGVMLGQAVKLATGAALPAQALRHFSSVQLLDSMGITLAKTLREQFTGNNGLVALKVQVSFDYLA